MDSLKTLIHSLEATEINKIHVDINRNLLQISTSNSEHQNHSITFDGILRLSYLPDFTDPGTLLVMDIEYDCDILLNLTKNHKMFWSENSPVLTKFKFEKAYRIRILSPDADLEIYCLDIIENRQSKIENTHD